MAPRRSARKTKSMLRIENGEITRDRINVSTRGFTSDIDDGTQRVVVLKQLNGFVAPVGWNFPTCSWGLKKHRRKCNRSRSYKKPKYASINMLNKSSLPPLRSGCLRLKGPRSMSARRKSQQKVQDQYTNYWKVKPLQNDQKKDVIHLTQLLEQPLKPTQHVSIRSGDEFDQSTFSNTEIPVKDPTGRDLPHVCSVTSDEKLSDATDEGKASSCVSSESLEEPVGIKEDIVLEKNSHKSKRKKHRPRVKRDISKAKVKPKLNKNTKASLEKSGRKEKVRKPKMNGDYAREDSSATVKEDNARSITRLLETEANTMPENLEKEPTVTRLGFPDLWNPANIKRVESPMDVNSAKIVEGDWKQQCTLETVDKTAVASNTNELQTDLAICTGPACDQNNMIPSHTGLNESLLLGHGSYTELLLAQKADNNLQIVLCNQNREMVLAKPTGKIRAKVHLDVENERIWPRLALGGIPDEYEDQQYWEKERAVMKERVELFIQRMQVVQGHRRFSPWKGSVIDSVVGAFLTQNVSDHLSSSAFMSVTSRYPASERKDDAHDGDGEQEEVCFHKMKMPIPEMQLESQGLQAPDVPVEKIALNKDFSQTHEQTQLGSDGEDFQRTAIDSQEIECPETDSNEFSVKTGTSKKYENIRGTSIPNECINFTTISKSQTAFDANLFTNPHYEEVSLLETQISSQGTVFDENHHSTHPTDEIFIEMGVNTVFGTNSKFKINEKHYSDNAVSEEILLNSNIQNDAENEGTLPQTIIDKQYSDVEEDYCTEVESTIGDGWRKDHLREEVYCSSRNVSRNLFSHFRNPNFGTDGNHPPSQSMSPIQINIQLQPESLHGKGVHPKGDLRKRKQKKALLELEQSMESVRKDGVNQLHSDGQENPSIDASFDDSKTFSPIMHSKKRKLPLHAITGIERAHFEENQKGRKRNHKQDWEPMRMQTLGLSGDSDKRYKQKSFREAAHEDSVNWEAVRKASVEDLAETIKERGMHHVLSGRIKAFLKTVCEEHGSIDLEWLRKVTPEDAKAYLMSIHGLGVKSVECIRLLTLHHVAFPVDVNVGRICVRLGWVPIEPLPEELQLHLLELYPVQETIQKYLWPRLCTLDQKTLYEFHYQLITFGKVFCAKSKPNCNACPMKANCKHFASAFASAKPLLTAPNNVQKQSASGSCIMMSTDSLQYIGRPLAKEPQISEIASNTICSLSDNHSYFVEEPPSPVQTHEQEIADIEDFPFIYGSLEDFTEDLLTAGNVLKAEQKSRKNNCHASTETAIKDRIVLQNSIHATENPINADTTCCNVLNNEFSTKTHKPGFQSQVNHLTSGTNSSFDETQKNVFYNTVTQESISVKEAKEMLNAIVPLQPKSNLPAPKLKNVGRLRTVHHVYELTDSHSLLNKIDPREWDDPSPYLLAIWSPDESPDCTSHKFDDTAKFSSSATEEIVSATLLIPCRTATKGSFPLNGTYFQVNEVFADHESSLQPLRVPRSEIWSLKRRFVYFGTSVPNIFKGLTTSEIQDCFLHGYVCVRGFDRKTRAPKPLVCRLHFPASKQTKQKKEEN